MYDPAPAPHHALLSGCSTRSLTARLSGPNGLLHQQVQATRGPRVLIDGKWVLNFTSSNYLGLSTRPAIREETRRALLSWGISHATPRALGTDTLAVQLESALARLVQCEDALLFPSTLHASIDVLALLSAEHRKILMDERAYPISVSAARLALAGSGRLMRFRHNDAGALKRLLAGPPAITRAVIVCDGVYPESGRPASLLEISKLSTQFGTSLFVDDAHGFGLLGSNPTPLMPYGSGGGGTVLHTGANPDRVVCVSSLSKALGIPLAFAAGSAAFIQELRTTSASVVHSSPPSIPVVAAALTALEHHHVHGDALRRRLLAMVRVFRKEAAGCGLTLGSDSAFPVQSILFPSTEAAIATGLVLRRQGIWPVISLGGNAADAHAALRFVITTSHTRDDLNLTVHALANAVTETVFRRG